MKMHLKLATYDVDASVAFYAALLGAQPIKTLADYAETEARDDERTEYGRKS